MMTTTAHPGDDALLALLEEQDSTIGFASFGHDDAWQLGRAIVERAVADGLAITVAITFGEQRVFHAARPGTSADNDDWLARKARVVSRFDAPSLLVGLRARMHGVDFNAVFGLDPARYAAAGGAFPLRVNGSLIGAVAVSGLAERDDHDLVVEALEAARSKAA